MNHHFDRADRHFLSVQNGSALCRFVLTRTKDAALRSSPYLVSDPTLKRVLPELDGDGNKGCCSLRAGTGSSLVCAQTRRAAPLSCDVCFRQKIDQTFENKKKQEQSSDLGLFKCWFELERIICGSMIHLTSSHFSHKNYFGFGGLAAISVT